MYSLYVLVVRGLVDVDDGVGDGEEADVASVDDVVPPLLLALLAWPNFSFDNGLLAGFTSAVNNLNVDLLFLRTRSCLIIENLLFELFVVGVIVSASDVGDADVAVLHAN
jgi:hypothetical protein